MKKDKSIILQGESSHLPSRNRRSLLLGSMAAALGTLPTVTWGQSEKWPARTITVQVGFPPGQATDIIARVFSAELSQKFGHNFVVENRPGAGSMLSARNILNADPDGYTFMWGGSGNLGIAPYLHKNAGYNPVTDFDTIMVTGVVPMLLVVRDDSPFQSVEDVLNAARSARVVYGSGGNGVTNHLATEQLKLMTEVDMEHIPYKGDAPALQDLIGGQFDVMFSSLPACIGLVQTGRLRPLAISTAKRIDYLDHLRNIPAVSETVPEYECVAWTALVGPKGIPADIKNAVAAEVREIGNTPEIKERLENMGSFFDPEMTLEKSRDWIQREGEKFSKVITAAKISVT